MFKLKYKMINKMIEKKVSSKDIDFILFLSKSLNELGQAKDIYYKEVCLDLNVTKQTFFDIIGRLNSKGIVYPSYLNKLGWDFTFDDNVFLDQKNIKESYLNTNRDFLFSNEFRSLKANQKLMILKLLILTSRNCFKISLYNLRIWFHLKRNSTILQYIESAKNFFDVSCNGTVYCFCKKDFLDTALKSAKSKTFKTRLKRWCLKYKIAFTMQDLTDVYNVFYIFESNLSKFFDTLVKTAFDYKQLQPAAINYILSS